MATATGPVAGSGLTRKVRVYVGDGSWYEAVVDEVWARKLKKMGWAAEKREERRAGLTVNATDARVDLSQWEGPRLTFGVLLGGSHPWDGPGSVMVEVDGVRRCRGCAHLPAMPASYYCLHCDRSGRERLIPRPPPAPAAPRAKPCRCKAGLKGGR